MRGRDPPCCLSQNRTICEHRILRRWLGPWAARRRETKAEGCCFHLPPPNMTNLSLFVLNQSDPDYLEIDMSAGRWCGLRSQRCRPPDLSSEPFARPRTSLQRLRSAVLSLSIDSGTTYVRPRGRGIGTWGWSLKGCSPVKAAPRTPPGTRVVRGISG